MKKRILFACFVAVLFAWTSDSNGLLVYTRNTLTGKLESSLLINSFLSLQLDAKKDASLLEKIEKAIINDKEFLGGKPESTLEEKPQETLLKMKNLKILTLSFQNFTEETSFEFLSELKKLRLLKIDECPNTKQDVAERNILKLKIDDRKTYFLKKTDLQKYRGHIPRVIVSGTNEQGEHKKIALKPRPNLLRTIWLQVKGMGYGIANILGLLQRARESELKTKMVMVFDNENIPGTNLPEEGLKEDVRKVTLKNYAVVESKINWRYFPGQNNNVKHLTLEKCDPKIIEEAITRFLNLDSLLIRKSYISLPSVVKKIEKHENLLRVKFEDCTSTENLLEADLHNIRNNSGIKVTVVNHKENGGG